MAKEIIETVVITPTKDMPSNVFKSLHHIAYYMELMDRLPDGRVVWNDEAESLYDESVADVLYTALQEDWFAVSFELPRKIVDQMKNR